MPHEENGYSNILKYHHLEKSIKLPFGKYADLESLHGKQNNCENNLEKYNTMGGNK